MRAEEIKNIITEIKNVKVLYEPTWYAISNFLTPESGMFWERKKSDKDKDYSLNRYLHLVDQTPIWALKTTISGIMNAIVPATGAWVEFFSSENEAEYELAADVKEFVYEQYKQTGFFKYLETNVLREFLAFGTTCSRIQYVDGNIKFKFFSIGTYSIGIDAFGDIDKVAANYEIQVKDVEKEFGFLPESLKNKKPEDLVEFTCLCIKNYRGDYDDKGLKREWIEYYLLNGNDIVKTQSYEKSPYIVSRFNPSLSSMGWGIGNGLRALGSIYTLQRLLVDFCNAVEEQFNPATIVNTSLFSTGDLDFSPGTQNFINSMGTDLRNGAVINARQIEFNYEGFFAALAEFRKMVYQMLDADIFTVVSGAGKQMTAYETDVLQQEKALRFGNLGNNIEYEILKPFTEAVIDFYYYSHNIRKEEIIDFKFYGISKAIKDRENLMALQNTLAMVGNLAPVSPEIIDNINLDKIPAAIAKLQGLDKNILTDILRSANDVARIRYERAQAMAMAQLQSQAQPQG